MNQGTNLGSQIGRWIILAAVVALLGGLLLTIRPAGAQDGTPNTTTVYEFPEVSKNPVDLPGEISIRHGPGTKRQE